MKIEIKQREGGNREKNKVNLPAKLYRNREEWGKVFLKKVTRKTSSHRIIP